MDKERRLGKRHKLPPVAHKVFVATPAYDGKVNTDYAMSLAQSCMHAVHQDIGVVSQVMGNGAFIEMARNIFVRNFLKTDCDILFFIDGDLKWESRAFVGLIQSGREVCAGAYRRRQEPEDYPLHYIEDRDKPGIQIMEGGWIACDRVATGFLCIHRHVLEAMVEKAEKVFIANEGEIPWIFKTAIVDGKDTAVGQRLFMGEDFAWCDDYMEQFDGPIYVWPDFDFVHDGYVGNWHSFMNKQVALAEQEDTPINLIRAEK
ncbi:MAG: hypothetical protein E4H01_04145 [Lysobacterales bacterium]|nr:MAG: hypothetical protein E4H01_04145 [Xanthomonadales bacterium]